MAELSDHELLAEFARTGAENAFAALVTRHVNLVFSTARRFTSDDHLAEEITQAVFIILARKAGGISACVVLTGWLYQTARLTAANVLKENFRRHRREQEAYMESTLTTAETDDAWKQIAPVLDDAMGTLREGDRNAVLLRYFENRPLAEVGAALGVSEDVARVRVNRALEKLRATLTKSGVTLGVTVLTGAVTANAIQAAPLVLANTITTAVLTGTSLTLATIAMTTLQKIAVTAALTVTVGAGIYEAKQVSDTREENKKLQAQQAPMAEQIRQLQREHDQATNLIAGLTEEFAKNKKDNSELLKLRGAVTQLREKNDALSKVSTDERETLMKSWLAREDHLKQLVEQNPEKCIPDFQLLTEEEWLNEAKDAQFGSAKEIEKTLANLRNAAAGKFGRMASAAVKKYMDANNGQFPTSVNQLQSYFDSPVSDAILNRWGIMPQAAFPNQRMGGEWVIAVNDPVDRKLDSSIVVGPGSYGSSDYHSVDVEKNLELLAPALKAYAADHGGKEPQNPLDIQSYLTTPEQQASFQYLTNNFPKKQ